MRKDRVTDQADGLRRLMVASPGRRVAVVGGEDTGVAGFTRNLAAALLQEGKDVLLVDERSGFSSPGDVQNDGRLMLIHAVLDMNGALSPLASRADHILVVLRPHAASIKASYACIKGLRGVHALQRLRVLVDGAADAAEAQRILANLADAGRRYLSLALEPGGWVRADPHLALSQGLHATVVDAFASSPAAMDYRQVARGLLQWPLHRAGEQERLPCEPALH